jgi:SAM-dependent methyltransferase
MATPSLYADLSHYYDLLCANIDYREQCEFALRANQLWGNGGRHYLDMACGSGALLNHFFAAGFDCSGLDISADMLALAAKRCPQARLFCADMSDLETASPLDFISCFLYSVHYCTSIAKLQQTFQRVYTALAPGGLFCFDAVDKDCIANDQGHSHSTNLPDGHLRFQTRWHYRGTGDLLDLHIDIHETTGSGQRHYAEHHAMAATNVPAIEKMLQDVGFDVVILEHELEHMSEWQGTNGNVVFCAVKAVHPHLPV